MTSYPVLPAETLKQLPPHCGEIRARLSEAQNSLNRKIVVLDDDHKALLPHIFLLSLNNFNAFQPQEPLLRSFATPKQELGAFVACHLPLTHPSLYFP